VCEILALFLSSDKIRFTGFDKSGKGEQIRPGIHHFDRQPLIELETDKNLRITAVYGPQIVRK